MATLEQLECNGYQAALPELVHRLEALEQRIEDLQCSLELHVNTEHEQRLDDLAADVKPVCLVDRIRSAAKIITDCSPDSIATALGDGVTELADRAHAALLAWRRDQGEK